MIKILFNAWFWNRLETGSGQYTRRLVEHLARLDANVELLLASPQRSGARVSHFHPGMVLDTTLATGNLRKIRFEQIDLPRACRARAADICHVPYWASPLAPSAPTVVTIHDLIPLLLREYRGGPFVRAYTSLVAATAHNAALVLTDSEASRRDILTHLNLPPDQVRSVPLAADSRYTPNPDPNDDRIRASYGLPERYTLYLGGFDIRKNVAAAIDAYTWVGPALGDSCPLVISGRLPQQDTPFRPDPRQQARQLEENWVKIIGPAREEDKAAIYRGAVAFIFPSRYEGFGLPPLEALACGTPVVGSNAASIPEVVGDAGVLLDPDDVEGMAGAVIQLAEDDAFRRELSQRAVAQATRFSWERTASETLAAYQDIVG